MLPHRFFHLRDKILHTYRETGLTGIARRSFRVVLKRLISELGLVEKMLYYTEARKRLSDSQIVEARRTKSALENLFLGETVFIIGTGPSLLDMNISALSRHHTVAVNSFFRHSLCKEISPTLYCFMDGMFFQDSDTTVRYFADLLNAIPSKTRFVVTNCPISLLRTNRLLPYSRTYYLPTDGDIYSANWMDFQLDELLPGTPNSVMFATLLAIMCGAKTVVMLGADHDWLARPNKTQIQTNPHFYNEEDRIATEAHKTAQGSNLHDYLSTIEYCNLLWRCYLKLSKFAASRSAVILNGTPGTFLDIFPYVNLADILPNTRHKSI